MDRTVYVSQSRNVNNAYGAAMMAAAARRAADRDKARARAEQALAAEVGDATRIGVKYYSDMGKARYVTDRAGALHLMLDPEVEWLEVWAV